MLCFNHIPSPLEGEGRVRGIRPHSADTPLLAAGRFIDERPSSLRQAVRVLSFSVAADGEATHKLALALEALRAGSTKGTLTLIVDRKNK